MKMPLEIFRPAKVKRSGNIAHTFNSSFGVLRQTFYAQANTEVPNPNPSMTPRLSGHFSTFGLVFFVLESLLGIARQ